MARTLKWPKLFQDVFSCYWPNVCGISHLTSACGFTAEQIASATDNDIEEVKAIIAGKEPALA